MNIERVGFEIVALKAGGYSLRELGNNETFHPVIGPMAEARILHVQQQQLRERASSTREPFIIWDVGLGAAANATAVREAFADWRGGTRVELHSFDQTTEPLEFAFKNAVQLGYVQPHCASIARLLSSAYCAEEPSCPMEWYLHLGDFRELIQTCTLPVSHAILYDPYSAITNPGMWTLEHFEFLRGRLRSSAPCMLSNYTRSTSIRVTLLLAGFFVGKGAAVGEKLETTVATNCLDLLRRPLGKDWLKRVQASTRGAPLRASGQKGPISESDLYALRAHPQFSE